MFLFVDGGISNGIAFSEINWLKTVSHIFSQTNIYESRALTYRNKWETGLIMGLGGNIRNFSCEFRYEITKGLPSYVIIPKLTRCFFILGYKF
jgi:hypothetical protein